MKFIYADSLDVVDPGYDFLKDTHTPGRQPYWDDQYPHEILSSPPYDGLLVSRAIVGDKIPGKYTLDQRMRFRREGARRFLRLEDQKFREMLLFGDCGAFSYHKEERPPYTVDDTLAFYHDGGFTHGFSVDHVIFEFDGRHRDMEGGSHTARTRFDMTLALADEFLRASKHMPSEFTPIGVIQGWSPGSMAAAAKALKKMGYTYMAVGGIVPLKPVQIHWALDAIRSAVPKQSAAMHLLGFAKADHIDEFVRYGITSFDSTSPLLRAFKDSRKNYYAPTESGNLEYFSAIRIPQALENAKLKRQVQEGRLRQEDLQNLELNALEAVRGYAVHRNGLTHTLHSVLEYNSKLLESDCTDRSTKDRKLQKLKIEYENTLQKRPWESCGCEICRHAGIEVVIFRASNRNKRRGIHNLHVFYNHVRTLHSAGTP
ncbi:tRNA-guanine transglycosylase DpdA [Wenzhouxiangella sp. XN24]|uniref:tRNA-guanine transglycosylase DpdA n=1 Tax=Wenzhouxiangella sp. XN24 TaxID=2713569 RepID=UPI0013EBB079|nr:hypothetical protein [Wenzhouxiangella sp. XN24]